MIIGPDIWGDTVESNRKLSKVFSTLTRWGLAPYFSTVAISHYQQEQVAAIEELQERALSVELIDDTYRDSFEVRIRQGNIEARKVGLRYWAGIGSVFEVSRAIQRRSRERVSPRRTR